MSSPLDSSLNTVTLRSMWHRVSVTYLDIAWNHFSWLQALWRTGPLANPLLREDLGLIRPSSSLQAYMAWEYADFQAGRPNRIRGVGGGWGRNCCPTPHWPTWLPARWKAIFSGHSWPEYPTTCRAIRHCPSGWQTIPGVISGVHKKWIIANHVIRVKFEHKEPSFPKKKKTRQRLWYVLCRKIFFWRSDYSD